MARLGRLGFLGVAVVFHVIYILSIFDVYFRSPIVSGMRAYSVDTARAPAQRLVLYVGDGLRADKAFQFFPDPSPSANHNDSSAQELRPLAPFLRSKVLNEGTFGVSHTRVPTESRPGHVALIAGLYEDVSSVTTGWKLNPVNFDSVFNRSRHTWQWGSPDILPMFSTGAVSGRVTDDTYGAEFEDFSKDATELDYWVFDKVKQLFEDAKTDADLNARLRQDKVVFFLHLLGLDTTGHAYRPYSREYLHNIKVVDEGVKEITKLIDDFYSDDQTAYVFTADHGMSDWGSHGDGHPDNTRTPLIAWGAGVAKPRTVSSGKAAGHKDGFSDDWHLDHVQRHDVAQADVAILMAYLAGLGFPVNSVGELPLSYLDASDEEKAKAMLVNAREILEMYRVKEEAKKATVSRYKPYPSFAGVGQTADERLKQLENMAEDGRYQQAIDDSDALMKLGLEGLRYLQTYDWLLLRTLVTAGYLGWIAFAFTTAVDAYILDGKFDAKRTISSVTAFASVLVALYSFLFVQSSPLTYYLYALFPVMFWEEVFVRRGALAAGKNKLFTKFSGEGRVKMSLNFLAYIGILEVMVQSYYHREIYTICYLLVTAWPAFYGMGFLRKNIILCATWALGCVSMSIFTLLPAIKTESTTMILIGGLLILAVGVMYIATEKSLLSSTSRSKSELGAPKADGTSRMILGTQVGLVALAMLVTRSSVASLQAKQGLPLGTQLVGWFTLASGKVSTLRPQRSTRWPSASSSYRAVLMASENGTAPTIGLVSATPTSSTATPASIAQSEQPADTTEELGGIQRTDTESTDQASVASYGRPTTLKLLRPEDSKVSLLSRLQTKTDEQPWRSTMKRYPVGIQIVIVILFLPVFGAAFLYVCWKHLKRRLSNRSAMDRGRLPSNADFRRPSVAEAAMVKPEAEEEVPPEAPEEDPAPKPNGQVASLVVPFLHALQPRDHYLHRLVVIFLAFGPMFIILTISYEGLFYLAITATLVSWVRLEHRIHQRRSPTSSPPASEDPSPQLTTPLAPALSAAKTRERALEIGDYRALTLADARICLFFLYLLQSAFFSTGNIASISSFSLDAVYRLLPIFDPFSQGALLLLKLLAPFALVSANLGILTRRLKLRGGSLFAVVMGIGDYLTLRFFWEVKDEGSWLDIGESITCFVIASMLCIFVAALEALSEVFIKGVEFADDVPKREGEKGHGNGVLNGGVGGKGEPVDT
ncbi:Glycosyl phosphatidyl inositol anchor synthesis [Elasticomyces elasticus]|nr:Glycosyl phosphatidyl inositol anchor synthesis [Elasticomyces elasticus]